MIIVFALAGTGIAALGISGIVYLGIVALLEVKVFGHDLRPLRADPLRPLPPRSDDLEHA
jgi:hypothetical protein